MSLLGKILAMLNILMALGFVYLAGLDYAKRQTWAHANLLHDLAMRGLPLDDLEADRQGRPYIADLSEPTLRELFPANQVSTQRQEVERVKQELLNRIVAAGDEKAQVQTLARILLPLALTNTQREQLIADVVAPKPDRLTDLKTRLDDAFAHALRTLQPDAASKRLTPDERRQAIAHLLFNLTDFLAHDPAAGQPVPPDPGQPAPPPPAPAQAQHPAGLPPTPPDLLANPAYRRFVTVVGVPAAIRAINDEARVLLRVTDELNSQADRERVDFSVAHQSLVTSLRERALELEKYQSDLARVTDQAAKQEDLVAARRRDVKQYEDELAESRKATAVQVQDLDRMREALFGVRLRVRDATLVNQDLEKKIRNLELGNPDR